MRSSDAPAAAESAASSSMRPTRSRRGVRRALLAGLGVTYVCAFVSLAVQIVGLVGSSGILPNRAWFSALAGRAVALLGQRL
jgi:hypothetical protein